MIKIIGDENNQIEITIIEVRGGQVSLGFETKGEIPIFRKELLEETKDYSASDLIENIP